MCEGLARFRAKRTYHSVFERSMASDLIRVDTGSREENASNEWPETTTPAAGAGVIRSSGG